MKKDDTRFTVRFNPTDPRHQSAMADLNASGRRKAALIAEALYYYRTLCNGTANPLPTPGGADTRINQLPSVAVHPQIPIVTPPPVAEQRTEASIVLENDCAIDITHTDNTPHDADMRNSILDAMNAFNG